jgi:hypothetical protein
VKRDALWASAAEVRELHHARKRVVCDLGPIRTTDPDAGRPAEQAYLDRLRLCRDKGFDSVNASSPAFSPALRLRAAELGLALATGAEEG